MTLAALKRAQTALHQGRLPEALALAQDILAQAPEDAAALTLLGVIHLRGGAWAEAEAVLARAWAAQPESAPPLLYRAEALLRLGRYPEALVQAELGLSLAPDHSEGLLVRGRLHEALGHWAQAEADFTAVLAKSPDRLRAWDGLGRMRERQGDFAGALAAFDHVLALKPDRAETRYHRGLCRLRFGDFAQGWADYEARHQVAEFAPRLSHSRRPLWDGRPFPGQTLLLHTEQGKGDSIMFARLIAEAIRRGGRVVLYAEESLVSLFASIPGLEVVPKRGETPPFDLQAPLPSLPAILGLRLEDLPGPIPYLSVPPPPPLPERGGRLKVGLNWLSSQKERSLPAESFRALLGVRGVDFYSLQYGGASAAARLGLVDLTPAFDDFAAIGGVIAGLDLVISIDSYLVHLAGALGRPVWTLLPAASDWRFLTGRDDSPWYPTMRLFRQERPDVWEPVVADLEAALQAL